jgi:murein DD-endopeptidase MepM/ murein hydrolase activator NlpD
VQESDQQGQQGKAMTRPLFHLACLLIVATLATAARQSAPVASQDGPGATIGTPREEWALALLTALGNAQPSAGIVGAVVEWTIAEDGGDGAMNRNNPLNTTHCGYGHTGAINGDGACGVGGYPTFVDGIAANAATLEQANFAEVRAALLANEPEAFKRALWASGWAESRYSGGAAWPQARSPAVPALVCPLDPCWQSGTGYVAGHPGIDLGATMGQPVYATMRGTVSRSDTWPCGLGVMVTDGDVTTLVCHLSGFAAPDGALVQAGEAIGYAGSSGLSTGTHVHFEIRIGGTNINPMEVTA